MKLLQRIPLVNLLFLLMACIQSIPRQGATMNVTRQGAAPQNAGQAISIEGMTVAWRFSEAFIDFTVEAPTRGWVAVGFNQRDDIVGAQLVMGAIVNDEIQVADHFVVRQGEHYPVEQIGGTPVVTDASGIEQGEETHLHFRLPTQASDPYHFDLKPGTSIYLIMAYSVDDDFAHHSRMRRHLRVTL